VENSQKVLRLIRKHDLGVEVIPETGWMPWSTIEMTPKNETFSNVSPIGGRSRDCEEKLPAIL
jgi:hypothetical protein